LLSLDEFERCYIVWLIVAALSTRFNLFDFFNGASLTIVFSSNGSIRSKCLEAKENHIYTENMARNAWSNTAYLSRSGSPVTTQTPITLACWVYLNAVTGQQQPVNITAATDSDIYDIQMFPTNPHFIAETGAASAYSNGSDGGANLTASSTGGWYHVAGVFASNTSRICYRNGVNVGGANATSRAPAAMTQVLVGKANTNAPNTFVNGSVAFPAIWNATLGQSDITSLAQGAHPSLIRPQNLVSCLDISGGASPEPDLVSSVTYTVNGTPALATGALSNPPIFRRH
jgi:Concanavalin A-like lectin/glucanases superfamily